MPQYYVSTQTVFSPRMSLIAAITLTENAVVTTTMAHGLITGEIVRLIVPPGFGMEQANNLVSSIAVLSPTTFVTGINTTTFDPYVVPAPNPHLPACGQVIPIGEVNQILTAATHNVLPLP